jgi:hypothetical protein
MKIKYTVMLTIWLLLVLATIFPIKLSASKISFKLSAGLTYLTIGDTNDYLKSFGEIYSVSKPFDYLHFGKDLSGEILYQITPKLSVYLGSGLISASLKDNQSKRGIYIYNFKNKTKAIPIKLGIRVDLSPGSSKSKIYLKAGAGYYFTTWQMVNVYLYPSMFIKRDQVAKANKFGAQGSIGWEIRLSKNLSFNMEATGRYLRVKDFKGEYRYSTSSYDYSNLPIKSDLYYYEYAYFRSGPWIPELLICGKPVGSGVRNVRPAEVDFSGFSLGFGFKINL